MADSRSAKKDRSLIVRRNSRVRSAERVTAGDVKECEELGAERPGVMICKDGALTGVAAGSRNASISARTTKRAHRVRRDAKENIGSTQSTCPRTYHTISIHTRI